MKLQSLLLSSAIALGLTFAAGLSQAATLYSLTGPTTAMQSPDSLSVSFLAGAGAGSAAFRVNGYSSLDGAGYYQDDFTLSLNGTAIFTGTWDLGGGGGNSVLLAPIGATAASYVNGYFQGGYADIFVPLNLVAGQNTLTFSYASTGYAGPQGLGDEGWGLQDVSVSGVSAVPEPATWAMMIMGFGVVGSTLRSTRRRGVLVVA